MFDAYRRQIAYLRLSLTSACQMRCSYCRPEWLTNRCGAEQLTPEELETVVRHLVARHGVHKVRLTGGDPTARPDLLEIIRRLAPIPGLRDLAMTTNGLTLHRMAQAYADAGLKRVNVSLDSLDPEKFASITGIDGLNLVLRGIEAAKQAGLTPIKINTVVLRDSNHDQLPELVRFAAEHQACIRFIELMPMGPLASQWHERYVSANEMQQRLSDVVCDWRDRPQGSDSAKVFDAVLYDGSTVDIGFITPMSCNFCHACDRLRLTSQGKIYPCLMDISRGSILPAVRPNFDPDRFDAILTDALADKAPEHPAKGVTVMTQIGG